ncbi:DUF914-domain-containing protein [Flagelloscypha sp. PMI_526]|nr:DUF914-domain-containing protein [Flagelloscypha sp. PMI_526]
MASTEVKVSSDGESNIHRAPSLSKGGEEPAENDGPIDRPKLNFSSPSAFFSSLNQKLKGIFTKRFIFALLAGQLVSICISGTSVATTELVKRNWALPTTQTMFLYFSLFIIYTPYTIFKYGLKGWAKMIWHDGWKYIVLSACDVEGNFLVVKAYQYTNLLNCMLLNVWATPVCMLFAWIYMRVRYQKTQFLGVAISICGLGLLVASDQITYKDYDPLNRAIGSGYMIAGATLYGFTNATEEFLVRSRPFYEVVGQLGMWGFIINSIQAAGLEHKDMHTVSWNGTTIGIIVAYTAAMFILYTFAPLIMRTSSSVYYNMSLLSSEFYGLIFGLGLYHYRPYWLYFIAFATVITGLIIYFWNATREYR